MKINETLGCIGAGFMGTAILEGLLKRRLIVPDHVWIYDKIGDKADSFSSGWKVRRARTNNEVAEKSRILILAVKPQDLHSTAAEFKNSCRESHIIISILAGTPLKKIREAVGPAPKIVRAMPNLGAKTAEAITALTSDNEEALQKAEQIFSGCGTTVRLDEEFFDLVTAISGSGPAYFFLLMELLMQEGIKNGMEPEKARLLAVQTAVGASLLAKSSIQSPEEWRKQVTSKGGTTEAALEVLEQKGFRKIFHEAVQAAVRRGKELSR